MLEMIWGLPWEVSVPVMGGDQLRCYDRGCGGICLV